MADVENSGTMERILRLMSEKKASDVYLSGHSPVLIRINGVCVPINSQVLPNDGPPCSFFSGWKSTRQNCVFWWNLPASHCIKT